MKVQKQTPSNILPVEKLWHILQGLPTRLDFLSCELLVAYKCCLKIFKTPEDPGSCLSSSLQHLKQTLQRLCGFLDVILPSQVDLLDQIKLSLISCVRVIQVSDVLIPLSLLGIFLVLCLINDDRPCDGRQLLHTLLGIFTKNGKQCPSRQQFFVHVNDEQYRLLLTPGNGDSQSHDVYITHLMHILLAYLCLYEGELENSLKHADSWSPLISDREYLYLKAFILFKQNHLDKMSVVMETWMKDVSHHSTAHLWNLCGCLFSQRNQPSTAIQMYKEAIKIDFDNVLPMFNIAKQFRSLEQEDAELEVLNTLIATMKKLTQMKHNSKWSNGNSSSLLMTSSGIQLGVKDKYPLISLEQALYSLCRRCLDLKRFSLASTNYLDLFAVMTDFSSSVCQTTHTWLPLPSTPQVFLECAFSMICSQQYESCITVCNQLIECCPQDHYITNRQPTDSRWTAEEDGKRKREDVSTSYVQFHYMGNMPFIGKDHFIIPPSMLASFYKADALLMLGKVSEAYKSIDSVAQILESTYVNDSETINTDIQCTEPLSKRIRLNSAGSSVPSYSTDSITHGAQELLAEAYSKKSIISLALQRNEEALTNSRLALMMSRDNITYVYNHTLLLYKLNRHEEAAKMWLHQRGINTLLDQLQAANILKRKKHLFLSLKTEVKEEDRIKVGDEDKTFLHQLDDRQLLNLDIVSLTVLERMKTF